ncbi:25S rRNA (adenine(2142)-N(1))-methyltransferase [Lecanosticta acicola]|uniref:25S rRNA adenine-N(1) methyltransferase n=1 Tax=Lecanosticta acicola TaxID=111012 RepID=A0AAI8Z234_9PEZI|nr:25S rRNA (adenine(2142)-N(1))-methyltransferase [Lecanosticta acicola]
MGTTIRNSKKKPALRTGRPPTAAKPKRSISSKATQKTIVTFHKYAPPPKTQKPALRPLLILPFLIRSLSKELQKAKTRDDKERVSAIENQIDQLGGIKAYQEASIQGQAVDRGGDTSIVLLNWLKPVQQDLAQLDSKFKLLEVGALSTKNACSKSGLFDVTRIDLNSQGPGIEQQDFMERPLPPSSEEQFDIISLSLVVNFVPDATTRGEMLKYTTHFLRSRPSPPAILTDYRALLFLVLPAPCTLHSRYFNEERLALIMAELGYAMVNRKETRKLVYSLWQLCDKPPSKMQNFPKVKVRDGAKLNNFHIVLDRD